MASEQACCPRCGHIFVHEAPKTPKEEVFKAVRKPTKRAGENASKRAEAVLALRQFIAEYPTNSRLTNPKWGGMRDGYRSVGKRLGIPRKSLQRWWKLAEGISDEDLKSGRLFDNHGNRGSKAEDHPLATAIAALILKEPDMTAPAIIRKLGDQAQSASVRTVQRIIAAVHQATRGGA